MQHLFFFYTGANRTRTTTPTNNNQHTHTTSIHLNKTTPLQNQQKNCPESLSIRRGTLDGGEGAGAAAGLRNFPTESPRALCARGHTLHNMFCEIAGCPKCSLLESCRPISCVSLVELFVSRYVFGILIVDSDEERKSELHFPGRSCLRESDPPHHFC